MKSNQKSNITNWRSCYYVANSFLQSAEKLYEDYQVILGWFNPLLYPIIVNCAFSCELFLKSLLSLENIEIRTHNLDKLYEKLNAQDKEFILNNTGFTDPEEFKGILNNHGDFFERFRYIHEEGEKHTPKSVNLNFLFGFARTIKLLIDEKCSIKAISDEE